MELPGVQLDLLPYPLGWQNWYSIISLYINSIKLSAEKPSLRNPNREIVK